ncbi:hypothetical protein Dsin_004947 [Dipteronia sinensis]|uniref:Purple acid phosphatase Fn3-like domain-containing protein n=1 Tax=Dipteronia sinensis TaxID=43782 RepID=A0AAE0EG08_9ROSI|nr:hypothetical protein Dsin_004947 [Dipteronia sinensis]
MSVFLCFTAAIISSAWADFDVIGEQPLSKIAIHKTVLALSDSASIGAYPFILGSRAEDTQWVTVNLVSPDPSVDDWVGVFSPAKVHPCPSINCYNCDLFSSTCPPIDDPKGRNKPYICSVPIKPKLVAVSNSISFANSKAPLYPPLAQGKSWDELSTRLTLITLRSTKFSQTLQNYIDSSRLTAA